MSLPRTKVSAGTPSCPTPLWMLKNCSLLKTFCKKLYKHATFPMIDEKKGEEKK